MSQDTTETITTEHVAEAIRRGRGESGGAWKIHAIRYLRLATDAGLKEAKELVERYEATGDCRTEDEITRDRLAEAEATIERLTGPEARERLARHLWVKACSDDPTAQQIAAADWDRGDCVDRTRWYAEADEIMAVIAGKEG